MKSRLKVLEGRTVSKAIRVEDYIQLHFEPQTSLNIYNRFTVSGLDKGDIATLSGATVREIIERPKDVVLRFTNGAEILIDLRDKAYTGPEAMELNLPGEPTVVWN